MKKYLILICAGLLLASCMNNWDTEAVDNDLYSAPNVGEPTTTIKQLRAQYAAAISNSSYTQVTTDEVIEGVVTANDLSGNIYQFIYIQPIAADGTLDTSEGGIGVGIKGIACLYTLYPVGQRIRINLNGLYVGGYGQSPRIGMPYINTNGAMRLGPMTLDMMKHHIQKVGKPRPELVTPRELTAAELTSDNITRLTPMLVVLKNAEIKDAGWPYAHWEVGGDTYSEYHDIIMGNTTLKQLLYTSTSATFAGDTIQPGPKTIYGLLGRYSGSYQLSLRSLDDIIEYDK
jgi:hypothetical protein